jgi:outer membrane protein assembly factor BamB
MFMMMRFLPVLLLSVALVACGTDKKPPLPGERVSILNVQEGGDIDQEAASMPTEFPAAEENASWVQADGNAMHLMPHAMLDGKFKKIWSADIGDGSKKERRLVTAPVVSDGVVFTADTDGDVSARSLKDGDEIWEARVLPKKENSVTVSPGIAVSNGRLFVTDGIGNVLALDAKTGKTLWTTSVEQPVRSAPTVSDGRVYAVTLQDETVALDTDSGTILWRHKGVHEGAGLLGSPGPAVSGSVVIATYSSGDVTALRAETGQEAWTDNLTGVVEFQSRAVTNLSGFRGAAVLEDDYVVVGNISSKTVAIHVPSGDRVWQKEFGTMTTPLVIGNSVFVITPQNQLMSLVKGDGRVRWTTELPRFEDPDDREEPIFWHGPILAGDRLILIGSHKKIFEMDLLRRVRLPDVAMLSPVVAGKTLLILTDDGDLAAYR